MITEKQNVYIVDHSLIKHKISLMRDKSTPTVLFRQLTKEVSILLGCEALRDLPTIEVNIETPIELCSEPMLCEPDIAVIPILRAGIGMLDGITEIVPTAKIGYIGLSRNEQTHEPEEYYCKLPPRLSERTIVLIDPMLATGGSAAAAVDLVKRHGGRKIKFISIIAAPKGIDRLMTAHPDIQLYVGCLDRCLNEQAYICPGLGDAGDRIHGTIVI
ncbi:MAG: uracil phosphoribosyltransferase [Spirochaetales bacterium]|nr:uracil phosphoribosyltransferase [Spirochaetales bacterium]